MKNATPRRIAFFAVLTITALVACLLSVLYLMEIISGHWSLIPIISGAIFLISYFVVNYTLEHYIYRKIKLIYKSIHRFKVSAKDKWREVNMNTDIVGEVEKEVSNWIRDQRNEIETLKALEEYRRNFLGDISHELKTPIFTIQGYIHTLLDGGLYDERVNMRYLNRAAKNVERLQTIVSDLESISRLESGELMLEMSPFDIKSLAKEVIEDLSIAAVEKNIDIIFKEGADVTFKVLADKESIRQVLTNLMTNSIKYGRDGGHTKVGFYDMGDNILVEVADNGIGISEDHLKHIFDRFYRVDKSRSRNQGGSGLGLSIVKHIIEAHKQTVNARSAPGVGSTFGFTLKKN